ncbi:hypothetical protein [Cytobacillus purgationiresistens]|uniref:Uncharacterized protein n=1 Tax=Cytobacillus purgationiresistens TaxID=863449 RepID=A0ABU0AAF3_9BACI|nr:hypothetical protein [Cytobacillus purgationiresistens]MDQ0268225.1 hypothetical protein [Cytobacillus purgationiresistens]
MNREQLALNHALMIEMIRSKGVSNTEMMALLKKGDTEGFRVFGDGIPDWQTFIEYYHNHTNKVENAIMKGFKITFLTKGALKSLLRIKYGLHESVNFQDCGHYLDELQLSIPQYEELQHTISNNWTIVEKSFNDPTYDLKIELTRQ